MNAKSHGGPRKVLLLNPPSAETLIRDFCCSVTAKGGYCWAPIDLLVISGLLKERFSLAALDCIPLGHSREKAMELALAEKAELVIALSSSASFPGDMAFLRELRERGGARIALLGNVCMDPEPWVLRDCPWIDALIADFASPDITAYAAGETGEAVPLRGIVRRQGDGFLDGREVCAGRGELSYPVPRHDLFPLSAYSLPYARRWPIGTVIASYGCLHACGYCVQSRAVMGYKSRPLAEITEELRYLRELGVRELYFRDPFFGSDRKQARALCQALRDEFDFTWSCDSRVDALDGEFLLLMKKAGCTLVAFGLETASEGVLREQKKNLSATDPRPVLRLCRQHGLLSAGYFILGLPGENRASAEATIRYALDCGVDFASFSVATPDFGTELRRSALESGRIKPGFNIFDRSRPGPGLSGALNEAELSGLVATAYRRFYGRPLYILRTLAGMRTPRQLREGLRSALAIARGCFSKGDTILNSRN